MIAPVPVKLPLRMWTPTWEFYLWHSQLMNTKPVMTRITPENNLRNWNPVSRRSGVSRYQKVIPLHKCHVMRCFDVFVVVNWVFGYFRCHYHHIDVAWAPRRLWSSTIWASVQYFVRANMKYTPRSALLSLCHWSPTGGSPHKGPVMRKSFHFMTSE